MHHPLFLIGSFLLLLSPVSFALTTRQGDTTCPNQDTLMCKGKSGADHACNCSCSDDPNDACGKLDGETPWKIYPKDNGEWWCKSTYDSSTTDNVPPDFGPVGKGCTAPTEEEMSMSEMVPEEEIKMSEMVPEEKKRA